MTARLTSEFDALADGARHRMPRQQDRLQPAGNAAQVQLLRSGRGPVTAASLRTLQRTAGNRAVAQLIGRPPAAPVVQRMSVNNTNWGSATTARHSSGGAVGVIIFDDGTGPVVVKAGEEFLTEAAVAAAVLSQSTGGGTGGWTASAPQARPVGAMEARAIRARAMALLDPVQQATPRTQGFLKSLNKNKGVMVYGHASGSELKDLLKQGQTVGAGTQQTLDPNSISYMLMNDPGLMQTFGRATAADILLGNSDRFAGKINFENVMVDKVAKSISLIDNVEANDATVLRDMPKYQTIGKSGFDSWVVGPRVQAMQQHNWNAITTPIFDALRDAMYLVLGPADQGAVLKTYDTKKAQMRQWFGFGLDDGARAIRKGLRDPRPFVAAIDPAQQHQVTANLRARWHFLDLKAPDLAWSLGEWEAEGYFPTPTPARPATLPPPQAAAAAAAPPRARGAGLLGAGHRRVGGP